MTSNDDPLRQLLVDATEIDRRAIAQALGDKVGIDPKSGVLALYPGYRSLDAIRKVLTILLARKAALLLGIAESEAISPRDMITLSALPPGTVAPMLRRLFDLRLVAQEKNKAYYIPNPQVAPAIGFLSEGD